MDIVSICWHGPYKLSNLGSQSISAQSGVYAIYRKFGNSQKLIYIGMTERSFLSRLKEHTYEWLWALKGELTIRFGILCFEENRRFSKQKLLDTESLLIVWCKPQMNTTNYKYYYGRDKIMIENSGRRGLIPKVINSAELIDA